MMRRVRVVLFALLAVVGCKDTPAVRGADGGAFVLPDAGFFDAGFYDAGGRDAGPFVCMPACTGGDVCGCLADDCGCHLPSQLAEPCDLSNPDTCAAPYECVRARREGVDVAICSDGREGISCSKTADICTTALGCVCYTEGSGSTDCRCLESHDPENGLCDRMVPETCPDGTCVRSIGSTGSAFFFCSDGAEGRACEAGDGSCRTSLGCTCPLVGGRERCQCSEPGGDGAACDPNVAGACSPPLMCFPSSTPDGITTRCSSNPQGGRDGGVGGPGEMCDPNDPTSCPPGAECLFTGQGFQCVDR